MDKQPRPWTADSGQDENGAGLLSATAAATLLGVNQRTIRRAIARGDLPAVKHAGAYQIDPTDLTRYLTRRRVPPPLVVRAAPDPPRLLPLPKRPVQAVPPLPRPLTPLIGREREAAAISTLLRPNHDDRQDLEGEGGQGGHDTARLVTLVGPGGVGKTRLAIRVAGDLATAFVDGVRFVPLAGISDPERVADAVARSVGSTHAPGSSVRTVLVAALREAETLLVLDNFEHVLAAAPLVTDLLAACPRLVVLVTSRTMLRVSGERAFPVPPLDLPAPGEATGLEAMARTPAVRLFAARAGDVAPSFALTAATVPIVADICRRLDGLPLAIELAAARANYLPVGTMRDRLERRLPLLTGGPLDASPRHRTMHDAIAWSYDLLTAAEQVMFRRLAVFAGGFSLDAVEFVGGETGRRGDGKDDLSLPVSPSSRLPVLDLLGSLVDKSLVRQDGSGEHEPRFGMLETVRAFALEHLEASGEEAAVRQRHADWYLPFVERFGAGADAMLAELWWLPAVEADLDNVRGALAWLDRAGETAGMLRLAVAIRPLWEVRGYHSEAIGWLERGLVAGGDAPPTIRLGAQVGLGRHFSRQGRYDQARDRYEMALALAREIGNRHAMAQVLYMLGLVETNRERYDVATPLLEESLGLFRLLDNRPGMCAAHYVRGIVRYGQGDFAGAIDQVEAAIDLRRANGPIFNVNILLNALGILRCEQGDAENGARALAESRSEWQQGHGTNQELLAEWLAAVARLELCRNRPEQAARLFGAAEALTESVGVPLVVPPPNHYRRLVTDLQRQLGGAAFTAAWSAGRALSAEEADAEAQILAAPVTQSAGDHPSSALSPRQVEILRFLAAGKTDRQIAALLFISVRTVERHVGAILARLDVPTRTAAVVTAIAAGLVPYPDAPPPSPPR